MTEHPPDQSPATPAEGARPLPGEPVDDPGRIRSHSRRLDVLSYLALVLAIVAAGLAAYALLEARDVKDAQSSADNATEADLDRVRSQLNEEVEKLGTRVDSMPTQSQISRLDSRIKKTQRDATRATNDATSASDDLEGLRTSVESLERQVNALESQVDSRAVDGGN